ncbi:uncharacterized protein LOC132645815 isoform X1 [Lycium barbarum]|uniref:uncharacterized protein LOC132645815 isoform X1 n=2 Tax=Lycium barbarum TaxID=112863 RepID=UPI00293F4196|nr:uncharacterized protein LOC132645815 isoform X1 [Lycium barbarum]
MTLLDITSTSLIYLTVATHCCNVKCYRDCEYVEVYGNCEVKISCPNLKFLKYEASMPKDIIIKNLLSIEDVHIVFTDTIRSVEDTGIFVHKMIKEFPSTSVLKLCTSSISGLYEATSKERLSPISFCKLKSLKLEVGVDEGFMQVMILLLKFSPNLEGLKLCSDENGGWTENRQMHDPDESLACLESHLKSIQLTGFKGEENEIELLRFFLKHARVLEKLMIVWEEGAYKSEEASEKGLYHVARTVRLSPVSFYKLKSLKLEVVIHEESMQVMILLLKYSTNMEVLKLWSDENVDESVNWQLLDLDESIVCLESHLK